MTERQLKTWLTSNLKEAEPLDRESALTEPQHVAITATKKLGLLGYGNGELLAKAGRVETPFECASVLIDCLSALPGDNVTPATTKGAMSVVGVAEQLGVSKETVYKLCAEGTIPHTKIGRRITVTPSQLEEYLQLANY